MTRFEEAVKIIAEEYREDCADYDCTIKELFRVWQLDNEDMQAEFLSILNEKFDGDFTDDCEVIDSNGDIRTFRQLASAIRKYQFV